MSKLLSILKRYIPERFRGRRFLLDQYHFDLTSFEGDVSDWVNKFPISLQNVEIYFALAELFRRRGEFDKAVSVHEALAKANLEGHSLSEITLEIAQDYYAAGVLGHAEELLVRALEDADEGLSRQAFRLWLAILESEQDWQRAVELVEQYGITGSGGLRLANLYCEYVQQVRRQKSASALNKIIRKASRLGVSARAEMLAAELATEQNQLGLAISIYRELLLKDPRRINLVLVPMRHLSTVQGSLDSFSRFMLQLYRRHPSVRILDVLLDQYLTSNQTLPADLDDAVEKQLKEGDSEPVLQYWLAKQSSVVKESIEPLMPALKKNFLDNADDHLCIECGFHSEKMVWLCPQCGSWETLYSRYELKIEQKLKKVT